MKSIIMAHPARYNLTSHDMPFHITYHDLQHEMSYVIPSQMASHAIHDIPSYMTLNVIHHHGTSRKTQQSKKQNLLHTRKQHHAGNQAEISHRCNNCTHIYQITLPFSNRYGIMCIQHAIICNLTSHDMQSHMTYHEI